MHHETTKPNHSRDCQRTNLSSKIITHQLCQSSSCGLIYSHQSQAFTAPSTHKKHRHPTANMNTPQENALLRRSSLLIDFFNCKERSIINPMEVPKKMKMIFWIQKNRQTGQAITLMVDDDHNKICLVRAAHRIYMRAKRLGQSDS